MDKQLREALEQIRIAVLDVRLEALTALHLPPFKGSTFRSNFGHALRRSVCLLPAVECEVCPLRLGCPHPYIFKTHWPEDLQEYAQGSEEAPRPFVLVPPLTRRTAFRTGEPLQCTLVLIGRGIQYRSLVLDSLASMGATGIGQPPGRFAIVDVRPNPAVHELTHQPTSATAPENLPCWISGLQAAERVQQARNDRVTLRFLTPARLVSGGRNDTRPAFRTLISRLLRRLETLAILHNRVRLPLDFRQLIRQAEGVRIVKDSLTWQDWGRFSGTQQTDIKLGGLTGDITYEGAVAPYLPFLSFGELVHVGSATVFGNGKYTIQVQ